VLVVTRLAQWVLVAAGLAQHRGTLLVLQQDMQGSRVACQSVFDLQVSCWGGGTYRGEAHVLVVRRCAVVAARRGGAGLKGSKFGRSCMAAHCQWGFQGGILVCTY
jgi:hypothetical protein